MNHGDKPMIYMSMRIIFPLQQWKETTMMRQNTKIVNSAKTTLIEQVQK